MNFLDRDVPVKIVLELDEQIKCFQNVELLQQARSSRIGIFLESSILPRSFIVTFFNNRKIHGWLLTKKFHVAITTSIYYLTMNNETEHNEC